MSLLRRALVVSSVWASAQWTLPARADGMELALSRLGRGACEGTLGAPLALGSGDGSALVPDDRAFRRLVSDLSGAVVGSPLGPVVTSGPRGFEVAIETSVFGLDPAADHLRRGTLGRGPATCDGRNDDVHPVLAATRLRFDKGLPGGLTLGAAVGQLHAVGSYLASVSLKAALLEEALADRVPDLALRGALTSLVGGRALTLHAVTLDVLVSDRFLVARALTLSPFVGGGAVLTRARTRTVDLTPNIDALACAAGVDPVCQAGGVGASADDLAHDVQLETVSLLRYRGYAGLMLRYAWLSLAGAAGVDLGAPRMGDYGRGARSPRKWTVSVAPGVTF